MDLDLSDRLSPAQVTVGALANEELKESTVIPANVDSNSSLVWWNVFYAISGMNRGNLLLPEFALAGPWSQPQGALLTSAAYDEIGAPRER